MRRIEAIRGNCDERRSRASLQFLTCLNRPFSPVQLSADFSYRTMVIVQLKERPS